MEVKGKKVKLSIWVRSIQSDLNRRSYLLTGHSRARTIPDNHIVLLSGCTGYYSRYVPIITI